MSTTATASAAPFLAAWDDTARRGAGALPDKALQQAARSWFDTVATTLGGAQERCAQASMAACKASAGGQALSATDTALVLGAASHALDYDDVCMLATCHPSAPVISALLALLPQALAQRPALSWQQTIGAYLVGVETMLRLGEWLGFRHYDLGFHTTDTLGTIGAAAACAHLLQLPTLQAHHALGISASSAGGLRANFGTDTKPLHAGFAASAGVRAALLAQAGATASSGVWGPRGFVHAFNGGEAGTMPWQAGQPWAIEAPGFEHKRFPSCYLTHRMVAGLLLLRARIDGPVPPADISVEFTADGMAALIYDNPVNGLQGKFSAQYCAAAAWHDGALTLRSFDDATVLRAEVRAQMARVHTHKRAPAGETLDTAPVCVRVQHARGEDSVLVDWAPGSPADPMSTSDLLAKWADCARHAGMADTSAQPAERLLHAAEDTPASDMLLPLRQLLLHRLNELGH